MSSRFSNQVLRFDGATGQFKNVFASGNGLANPNGIALGPDDNLYVGLGDVGVVQRYDGKTGAFLGVFVADNPATPADESGGNGGCRAIAFGPDGDLYVDAGSIDKVLRYDGATGAFKGVAAEGNGMRGPVGLTFGPDGNMYVGAAISNGIYAFGPQGNFIRRLSCGDAVTGVIFGPDGFLYGASSVANVVRKYDLATGACLGVFASGGGLSVPIGVGLAPDGNLLVGSFNTNSVLKYSFTTGQSLGTFIAAGAGGLSGTHNFLFTPPDDAARKVVPIVLDVVAGSAHYATELVLTNRGAASAHVKLDYHPSLGTGAGAVDLTLDAGEQRVIADSIAELRTRGLAIPASPPQGGTLDVILDDATTAASVDVTARTATSTAAPQPVGRAGLAYAALDVGDRLTGTAVVYGLRSNDADRSNLAVFNTGSTAITVRMTVFSGAGGSPAVQPVVVQDALALPAFGWAQVSGVLNGTGISNGWAVIELTAGSGTFSAYGVVNDNGTNDGSFLAPVAGAPAGNRITVPVLVETSTFRSELVLTNRSASGVDFTLDYREALSPGDGAGGRTTVHLGPAEQRIIPEAVDFLRRAGLALGPSTGSHAGPLRITVAGAALDQVFAGARTAAVSLGGGQFGLFTPGMYAGAEAAGAALIPGLRADATNRSNVAVENAGDDGAGPVTLEVHVFDGDDHGLEKGSPQQVILQPGAFSQFNNVLAPARIRNGWVVVRRVDGTAPWIAYGVVNDGGFPGERTGDGAYVPMRLLETSTPTQQGDTIISSDGGASLFVPSGSLPSGVTATLVKSATRPLDPNIDVESLYDVGPAGAAFVTAPRLTLRYAAARIPAGIHESALGISALSGDTWVAGAGFTVDTAAHLVSASIAGPGKWGVRRAEPTTPCAAPEHRQFDFWLGTWGYSAPQTFPGTNVITRDTAGCTVEEHFTEGPYRGRSVSLFDPATAKWYQTYVDSDSQRLVLAGAFDGTRMVLYETATRRYVWQVANATQVRYFVEDSHDGGATWSEVFTSFYTKR